MNEVSVEKRLKKKVNENGGLALKLVSPGFAGVPDRLVLFHDSRIAFVELKAPLEIQTSSQHFFARRLFCVELLEAPSKSLWI